MHHKLSKLPRRKPTHLALLVCVLFPGGLFTCLPSLLGSPAHLCRNACCISLILTTACPNSPMRTTDRVLLIASTAAVEACGRVVDYARWVLTLSKQKRVIKL